MKDAYTRSIEREGTNGLIILAAFYGKLPTQIEDINNETENLTNVLIPLQLLIKEHSLQILNDSSKVSYIQKKRKLNKLFNLLLNRVIYKASMIHASESLKVYLLNINLTMSFTKLLSMIMILYAYQKSHIESYNNKFLLCQGFFF